MAMLIQENRGRGMRTSRSGMQRSTQMHIYIYIHTPEFEISGPLAMLNRKSGGREGREIE